MGEVTHAKGMSGRLETGVCVCVCVCGGGGVGRGTRESVSRVGALVQYPNILSEISAQKFCFVLFCALLFPTCFIKNGYTSTYFCR